MTYQHLRALKSSSKLQYPTEEETSLDLLAEATYNAYDSQIAEES